jgi:hypothetical protein
LLRSISSPREASRLIFFLKLSEYCAFLSASERFAHRSCRTPAAWQASRVSSFVLLMLSEIYWLD